MDNIYDFQSGSLWKDENFDFTNARSTAGTVPSLVVVPGTTIEVTAFNGTATAEQVCIVKELNHDYQEGTDLFFHTHWFPTTTASGFVKWNIDYWITHSDFTTVISGTLSVKEYASPNTAWVQKFTSFPNFSLGALGKIGSQIAFRFYRDPTDSEDTYGAPAAVATIGWHYLTNSRGSSQLSSK
jgi:hypothetical protein